VVDDSVLTQLYTSMLFFLILFSTFQQINHMKTKLLWI